MMSYTHFISHDIRPLFVAALLSLSCMITPAQGAEMDEFDSNSDGKITFEEVMKHLEPSVRKSFDALDRNRDGVLSDKDFDDVREGMQQMEEWLQDLIRPLLEPARDNEAVEV